MLEAGGFEQNVHVYFWAAFEICTCIALALSYDFDSERKKLTKKSYRSPIL